MPASVSRSSRRCGMVAYWPTAATRGRFSGTSTRVVRMAVIFTVAPRSGDSGGCRFGQPGGEGVTPGGAIVGGAEVEGERTAVAEGGQAAEDVAEVDDALARQEVL